ncbi:hypothetical protein G4Z16_21175 [Streptomyces bathyalis]|uniref:Uncharacterized protein n=1 Tax=Streptomyces bathyalis TaxID=2710756 RepID=A0A7T1TDH1_9ACTN|nr:hypothetical protein [Streptomyces bathyalis]QPP10879.1 hypothetical protein G4Z16_21175 [Streptomyces bathyalis]
MTGPRVRKGWAALAEVLAWWAALTGLWMVLITTVDPVESAVGATLALPAAVCARAARRAARQEVLSG